LGAIFGARRHEDSWVHTNLSLSSGDTKFWYSNKILSSLWLSLKIRAIEKKSFKYTSLLVIHTHSVSHFNASEKLQCTLHSKINQTPEKTPTKPNKENTTGGILYAVTENTNMNFSSNWTLWTYY